MIKEALGPDCGRVIDFHTHILVKGPDPRDEDVDRLVRLARYYGIRKAVFQGNAGIIQGADAPTGDVVDTNTYTLRLMERRPDFFIGFAFLNPAHPVGFSMAEINRCIVSGGMKGVKLLIALKATDKRLDPIMERLTERGVPVLHHTWYKAVWQGEQESTPADLAELALRHPEAKIILAHLGGGRERGVLDLVDFPNLHYGTSGSQPEAGLVEYAVRKLGAERVVFGSDWPCRDFGVQLGRILAAEITPEQRSLILRGNAERLLGLEGGDA